MNMLQDNVLTVCLGSTGRSAPAMFLEWGAILFGCDIHPIGINPAIGVHL